MNPELNNKIRPKYFSLTKNEKVVGVCILFKQNPPPGWEKITEQEYLYLSKSAVRSSVIGATK